jgi:hypothetical protein
MGDLSVPIAVRAGEAVDDYDRRLATASDDLDFSPPTLSGAMPGAYDGQAVRLNLAFSQVVSRPTRLVYAALVPSPSTLAQVDVLPRKDKLSSKQATQRINFVAIARIADAQITSVHGRRRYRCGTCKHVT